MKIRKICLVHQKIVLPSMAKQKEKKSGSRGTASAQPPELFPIYNNKVNSKAVENLSL